MSTPHSGTGCNVIVVEDDVALRQTICEYLERAGHGVRTASGVEEGWRLLVEEPADALIADLMLPDGTGVDLLARARELYPSLAAIVMTGFGSLESAVESMRLGAADYLSKPFSMLELERALQRAIRGDRRPATVVADRPVAGTPDERIIGRSPSMTPLFEMLDKLSQVDSTVLITGESGVGKELVVHELHARHPQRGAGPLVAVHCGAIPESLIDSELFGHCRGAFTGADRDRPGRFELAHGGTLFLDEVGTMRPETQVRLLRVLQSRHILRVGGCRSIPVDVRVVAASNEDLALKVERGEFREDLYYRLNVIPLAIPPLRARRSDIPLLASHFASRTAARARLPPKEISQEAMRALMSHEWPGNVRELENVIEYATVMSGGRPRIETEDLPFGRSPSQDAPEIPLHVGAEGLDFRSVVSEVEKNLILQSLELAGGNKARAAQLLDLKRTTFIEKLKRIREGVPTG
jgi:DNA-binding NtrC family response regulator